jgi:FMN reductase
VTQRSPLVVGLGGTTRAGSSSEVALRIALKAAAAKGATIEILAGRDINLPMYPPDSAVRSPEAKRLVDTLRRADGVILASPGYHGSLSGLLKNALDYGEDLRSDQQPYLAGRAVGCIACAYGWQATGTTLIALRSIVHALRGWPTPMGVGINSATKVFGPQGDCLDQAVHEQLETLGTQVVEFVKMRQVWRTAA